MNRDYCSFINESFRITIKEYGVDELELGLDVGGMIPLAGGADG